MNFPNVPWFPAPAPRHAPAPAGVAAERFVQNFTTRFRGNVHLLAAARDRRVMPATGWARTYPADDHMAPHPAAIPRPARLCQLIPGIFVRGGAPVGRAG